MSLKKNAELEEIVAELSSLAKRKPLSEKDQNKAKEVMIRLREMGFTNREVSELTEGGWSKPTVKLYTRGSNVKNSNPKNMALKLLTELFERGLTLDHVEETTSFREKLGAKGLTVEGLSNLLEEAQRFRVDVRNLLGMHNELTKSKLNIGSLKEALAYKAELESAGFTLEALEKLSEASKAYGDFAGVMEAVNSYGRLEAVRAERDRVSSEKTRLDEEVGDLRKAVKDLEGRKVAISPALQTYDELVQKGFDTKVLEVLKEACAKHGDVSGVLKAVDSYANLESLELELSKVRETKANVEAELKRVNAEHAHLQTVIGVCETLLYEYKFSVQTIDDLYKLAKKYGKPLEVLKAIGKYGEFKVLESEVGKLTAKKGELEARVAELEAKVQELRAVVEEMKLSVSGILEPLSNEVKKGVELITATYKEAIDATMLEYNEFTGKFGALKADAGKLEEELKLARAIQALIKYPTEAQELPLDYDILMLRAIIQHCTAKNINPKVKAGDPISKKQWSISSGTELELLDLLEWASRGLASSLYEIRE